VLLRVSEAINNLRCRDCVLNRLINLPFQIARCAAVGLQRRDHVEEVLQSHGRIQHIPHGRVLSAHLVHSADEFLALYHLLAQLALLQVVANLHAPLNVVPGVLTIRARRRKRAGGAAHSICSRILFVWSGKSLNFVDFVNPGGPDGVPICTDGTDAIAGAFVLIDCQPYPKSDS
jgi:hypothetical protein